jgi:hypothetical protein
MLYFAEVVRLNDEVEEEVVLRINGVEITCFAGACPYQINEGGTYQVALTPMVFADYSICQALKGALSSLTKVGAGLSYEVIGKLVGNHVDAEGIVLEDDVLLRDHGHLDGRMVVWMVGRIDVEFLLI